MILPSIPNAVKAIGRVVEAVVNDEPVLASDEIVTERLATCETCEFLDPEFRQCRSCTCAVDLKANFITEPCPEKKWKR